jgi:transcription-repair coupling factor (superfamily II helicase)
MAGASVLSDVRQRLRALAAGWARGDGLGEVIRALAEGRPATIDGVLRSCCALVAAALWKSAPASLAVICAHADTVDDFVDDLALFSDCRPLRFPAWEGDPGQALVHDEIYRDRLRALKRLLESPQPQLVLSSVQALLQPVPPPAAIASNSRHIVRGRPLDCDDLARWLVEHNFHAVSGVELPGEFSRRGGIVDVFAPSWDEPVRIELFGDIVESLRTFDVSTQRSLRQIESCDVTILPSTGVDAHRLGACQLLDYLPAATWVALMEPDQVGQEAEQYRARSSHSQGLVGWHTTARKLSRFACVELAAFAAGGHETTWRLPVESVERFSGEVVRVRDELDAAAADREVVLVCQTQAEIDRLHEVFGGSALAAGGRLHFVAGRLSGGFHLVDERLLLLGGNELFRRTELRRQPRRRVGKRIDTLLDLRDGDLVVHLAHGIGRFRGMESLVRDGHIEEHLAIEFHGGTRVYLPATKIDLIQRYVGGTKARPRLATLGGKGWLERRKAAESAVTDMAAELLDLQALRAARPGIAFSADSEWQREFDASFPYEETEDQTSAVEAIKLDMEAARPMDRLLCGDVGFGKTEVAMRAAFKAVDNGYQVAILVPTTILAEQHFQTLRQRMAEFPFEIARLSRFCSTAEQSDILQRLAAGQIDIVIGTHRLASDDIRFENLGLLIIDEEQRFGVEIKEKLKSLRATVDVLTMTATPIPRTLHMALTGMRDISNLEIPPEDRIAVETRVVRWNEEIVRSAILRELNREGQVYFVHNRVHDMGRVLERLETIVPEARIRVAHGQMPEGELERVMVDFVAGRADVLLATTIVESGLDIANANTMFIDDADQYGLADLHQLRGRVGRYKHRAYCYLLVDRRRHVTPEAARRLRAIEEFSQMGAGFAIAMRDLEFRGAGNILGTEQSGHIAAVGYELYCQLLEAAVRKLKKLPPKRSLDVVIDLPGAAFIPNDYVPDQRAKIDLYRRIARIASDGEQRDVEEELRDRFGSPPPPVLRLLALAELRMSAAAWAIHTIRLEDQDHRRYVVLECGELARLQQLARRHAEWLRVVDGRCGYLRLPDREPEPDELMCQLRSVLRTD